ncbi:hypothetical protein [Streptomyces halobius]|uniref:Uncharacterized protein n=1 Tax=Streptomyces halobius TaxID=2879846 RepID=A0ABY4M455_9ACTN|nr:hypothetical protein [Streptomyces halobius]UQA92529.1 hypothetical protein K9S39_12475 [Streptomyces halobius]
MLVADPGLRDAVDGEVEDASAGARAELAGEVEGAQHAQGPYLLVVAQRDWRFLVFEGEEPQRLKVASPGEDGQGAAVADEGEGVAFSQGGGV